MKSKISFVIHGKIRGRKKFQTSIDQCFGEEYTRCYYYTQHARHAEDLTIEALADGCDYLIAVGGDGTVSEVVNAFLRTGGRSVYSTILGILPMGTGNDFVKSLGELPTLSGIHDMISRKSVRLVDAGRMEFRDPEGNIRVRYFDNIADLGIGAEVVSRVNGVNLRKIILGGTLVFFLTALQTFLTYRHKRVTIAAGDFKWSGRILSVVIANGRFFGSGLGIAPDARIDDGKFSLVIFGDLSVWDYLKNYGSIRKSRKVQLAEVQYYEAVDVLVTPEDRPAVTEADGEIVGFAPMRFQCLPAALPFLSP